MRKIIQLAPTYDEDEALVMYALCDDGTVLWFEEERGWLMLDAEVPQKDEQQPK